MKLTFRGDSCLILTVGSIGQSIFGVMFALSGLVCIVAGLTVDEMNSAPPAWYVRLGICLLGSAFALVGLVIIGFFENITIDRHHGSLTRKRGVFFFSSKKTIDINGMLSVILSKDTRVRDSSGSLKTTNYYPIKLKAPEGEELVAEPRNATQARSTAESLAAFLSLQMTDRSRGKTVIRNPDELNMGIAGRWMRNGEEAEYPECPDSMKGRVKDIHCERANFTSLYFPSMAEEVPKMAAIWITVMFALLGFIAYRVWPHAQSQGVGDLTRTLLSNARSFWVIAPGLVLLGVVGTVIEGLISTKLMINRECICIVRTLLGIPRTIRVQSSKLEGIDLDKNALIFVTDRKRIKFKPEAKPEEVEFCAKMIKYVLLK